MKRKLLLFILLSATGVNLYGQHEMTMFHMNNVFQGTYVNPTLVPEHKVSIGLPGISSNYVGLYTPFIANDLKEKSGDSTVLSLTNAIKKMSDSKNLLGANANVDLFSLRFKARSLYISLSATNKTSMRFNIPRDFLDLVWNGNAQYIGGSADFSNTELNFSQYNEYALGITRAKDGGKLIYGVRLKMLQGLNNLYTEKSNAEIAINSEYYQHTLTADYLARSSSVLPYDSSLTDSDYIDAMKNFKNLGWGLDLGLTYNATKRLSLTGALNNLGSITWQTNTKSHSVDGTYEFKGISLDDLVGDSSLGIQAIADSLQSTFNVQNASSDKYKTKLAPVLYLAANYKLGRSTNIAITGSTEFYRGIRPVGSVALIQKLGRIVNIVISYNVRRQSYNNLGFGLMFKPLSPFQFYVATDNIPFNFFNTNNVNIRTGMNLVFGRSRKPEMQTHNED